MVISIEPLLTRDVYGTLGVEEGNEVCKIASRVPLFLSGVLKLRKTKSKLEKIDLEKIKNESSFRELLLEKTFENPTMPLNRYVTNDSPFAFTSALVPRLKVVDVGAMPFHNAPPPSGCHAGLALRSKNPPKVSAVDILGARW